MIGFHCIKRCSGRCKRQLLTGAAAAIVLAFTAKAMTHILGAGAVSEHLHAALPALIVVTAAAAVGRVSSALSSYADGRITPLLMTEADVALWSAVCRVEASAYGEDGFSDRREAAEVGVTRTRMMVQDAQRFMTAVVRMIAASGVITALHWMMLPLLLLAVLPAGTGAVLSARVDYETHYANVGDRNVRAMMRWWAAYSRYGDEVRAHGMTSCLVYWYRALSDRIDESTLTTAASPSRSRPPRWSPSRPPWPRSRSSSSTAPRCSTPRCTSPTCVPSSTWPPNESPSAGS